MIEVAAIVIIVFICLFVAAAAFVGIGFFLLGLFAILVGIFKAIALSLK